MRNLFKGAEAVLDRVFGIGETRSLNTFDAEKERELQESFGAVAVVESAVEFDSEEKEWFEAINKTDEVATAIEKKAELEKVLATEPIRARRDHFRAMIQEQEQIIEEGQTEYMGYSRIQCGYAVTEFVVSDKKNQRGYIRDRNQVGHLSSTNNPLPKIGGLYDYIRTMSATKVLFVGPVPTEVRQKIEEAKPHFDEVTILSHVE